MAKPTETPEWQALLAHQKAIEALHMQDWFKENPKRFDAFSLHLDGILFDYSKNRINDETLPLLIQLARSSHLKEKITALLTGDIVNPSEKRAALHTALRAPESNALQNDRDILPTIHATLKKMRELTEKVRHKTWLGATGKPIRSIVNIGIGGSHLGPLMTIHALKKYVTTDLSCHFISNMDDAHCQEVIGELDPETTLFIVSSKSFTTIETLTNAKTCRQWLQKQLGTHDIQNHFIAITAKPDKAIEWGILEKNILPIWDWVGGRYSVWSAVGLPLAFMIGMDEFLEFLAGAHALDEHFREAPFSKNMPVILALLGIWYINFFGASHQAIIPYSHRLHYFREYIQQLEMESNGKRMSRLGQPIDFLTCPVVFGEQGSHAQHAFHQLLHQGQHLIPVDFILTGGERDTWIAHHDLLISSGLSQAEALMRGKSFDEAYLELQNEGYSKEESEYLALHKMLPGNRPSNILFLNKITPYHLGMLIALYEHKTFVQGVIWDINSFDQWGVELGKTLLPRIFKRLHEDEPSSHLDSSTEGLIEHYKKLKKDQA